MRPHALRRILTNLVDNALKFGGTAELERRARGEGVRISVLDRGPGIPEDQLEAVLQPFFRLEHSRSRDTGGTGLGLADRPATGAGDRRLAEAAQPRGRRARGGGGECGDRQATTSS